MTPLEESNRQFRLLMERNTRLMPNGVIRELDGMVATFGNVPVPFFNMCFLSGPVATPEELHTRLGAAIEFAAGFDLPWFFGPCHEWLPEGGQEAITGAGFLPAMRITGMAADALLPPRRPLPDPEFERIREAEGDLIAAINQAAYQMPAEASEHMFNPGLWGEDSYAYVGRVDGEAVTCAATFVLEECLYVAWVATLPGHQRKGYAEAAIRHSLSEAAVATVLKRTVLHASSDGLSLYEAMGYERTSEFTAYAPQPPLDV